MTDAQIEVCKMALKRMMSEGTFSICTIDTILAITGGVPNNEDYKTLRALHCVKFMDFTPTLRLEFPKLLQRVLESPSMDVLVEFKPRQQTTNLLN